MSVFSCVVIGNESLLIECSRKLLARGHKIAAVVTDRQEVAQWAVDNNLPVLPHDKTLAERLSGTRFDWLFSIANLRIIADAVLALPEKGSINFHDGPLPRHAGLNAPIWALIEGETEHGIAWHMIESGVDTGDIVARARFAIDMTDTALTLNTKAYEAGLTSFGDVLTRLEEGAPKAEPQDKTRRSYHARADRPGAGEDDVDRGQQADEVVDDHAADPRRLGAAQ